jgi:hypothetical protein
MVFSTYFFEMEKPCPQIPRAISLEQIGNLRRTIPGWSTDNDVDMIQIGFHGQQNESMPLTTLGEQFLGGLLDLTGEHRTAVLGNPHEVIGDRVVSPSRFTRLHTTLLLC